MKRTVVRTSPSSVRPPAGEKARSPLHVLDCRASSSNSRYTSQNRPS